MSKEIKQLEDRINIVTDYCQRKYDNIIAEFNKAVEEDRLTHFMAWNGTTLHQATVYRDQSRVLQHQFKELNTDDELTDEDIIDRVKWIFISHMSRELSQSTSISSNLNNRFVQQFYQQYSNGFDSIVNLR